MFRSLLVLACTLLPGCARWARPESGACWGAYHWSETRRGVHELWGSGEYLELRDDGTYEWSAREHYPDHRSAERRSGRWRVAPGGVRLSGAASGRSRYFLVTDRGRAFLLEARWAREYCADWIPDDAWDAVLARPLDSEWPDPPTLESFCAGLAGKR